MHTPGPWEWLPNEGQFVIDAQERIVAEIPCQGANPADGPLIAAAPDMLEALQSLMDFAEHGDITGRDRTIAQVKTDARAAIKKAKGK